PGVTLSHKWSPRTDALLIKRRRKLGPAKIYTLSPRTTEGTRSSARANASRHSTRRGQSRNDYKITPNRIGLKPRIALSIRAY
ncbi:hypothetical protein TSAR_000462, partial [Trichomalopsis sarcophagae]